MHALTYVHTPSLCLKWQCNWIKQCVTVRMFICDVKKCHDYALKVRSFPIYIVSICLPVALLEELHSSTSSVSTGMPSLFNSFTGIVTTLKTSTSSPPCGRGVSNSTVIVTEPLKGVNMFASTCFLRTDAPSSPVMVTLYHLVGNKGQSGDTWGQEVREATCMVRKTVTCIRPLTTHAFYIATLAVIYLLCIL